MALKQKKLFFLTEVGHHSSPMFFVTLPPISDDFTNGDDATQGGKNDYQPKYDSYNYHGSENLVMQ